MGLGTAWLTFVDSGHIKKEYCVHTTIVEFSRIFEMAADSTVVLTRALCGQHIPFKECSEL